MSWTRPADLRSQVQRLWDRGELLQSLVTEEGIFPRRLVLKVPNSSEITSAFDEVRLWTAELRSMPRIRVEMREFNHRVFGHNSIPQSAWIDSLDDALALLGKSREAAVFADLVKSTRQQQPQLLEWMAQRPLNALPLADSWERLLKVVDWMKKHPRPAIYLRQVDIPGVHSKLIEAHRSVLTEWLNLVLSPHSITPEYTGISQFAARFGFREKPEHVRFRVFDPVPSQLEALGDADITLDADHFAALNLPLQQVFITENETNFLAFPTVANSAVVFGAGYGCEALARADWLRNCKIRYWGDIDTHGFAILNQLRSHFGHVESLLMDRETLMVHQSVWGVETKQVLHDLSRLNPDETAIFNDLRDNRIRKHLRLEQELVGYGWLKAAIGA